MQRRALPPPIRAVDGEVDGVPLPGVGAGVVADAAAALPVVRHAAEFLPALLPARRVRRHLGLGRQVEHRGPEAPVRGGVPPRGADASVTLQEPQGWKRKGVSVGWYAEM